MTILDSIILGIVEGITEFLPVSSTGHLILASNLLSIPPSNFLTSFEIAIQLGAIGAVVFLYWRSFFDLKLLKKIIVAFLPTVAVGFLLYPFIKSYLLGNSMIVVASLALGGVILIVFELWHKENESAVSDSKEMSYGQALAIGLFQSIAVIPGVSRSAATILGGLLMGLKRVAIVEFSFLLAVPTMAAATGYDLFKNAGGFVSPDLVSLAIGFVVSFLVAMLSIKFLLGYIRNHSFIAFGIYRILVAIIFLIFIS